MSKCRDHRTERERLAGPDYYPCWHPVVLWRRALRWYVLRSTR